MAKKEDIQQYSPEMQAQIKKIEKELKKFTDARALANQNLKTFDELDFEVFSHRDWARLHESHHKDIKVNWPDGHSTTGIERHIKDLDAMFVYAPDTKIAVHPVKIGSEDWTAVIGVMTGTFSDASQSVLQYRCAPMRPKSLSKAIISG